MDHRLRIVTAAAVMLVGLGLASLFRRPSGEADLAIPVQSDSVVLLKPSDPRTLAAESSPAAQQPRPLPTGEPRHLTPTIVSPTDRPGPPPELPKRYPDSGQVASTRWGTSLREMLPETASSPPIHKVIDGDSLALLAERYLGSASRAMEIYEANRNVLTRPEELPIGAELKIPRADQVSTQGP